MANILAIFPGQSFSDLCSMEIAELMRWHGMAEKRSEK